MCEHCGCRENPEIGKLGSEHDAIVELSDQVLAEIAAGTETPQGAAARLRALIIPHVRGEEAGAFSLADEIGLASQYTDDLREDHVTFDSALSEDSSLTAADLDVLLAELYRHIAVEEYDLFPLLARELNRRRSHPSPR